MTKAKTDFPKWAPADAIEAMNEWRLQHYAANDPRRGCPDMLYRLLTYEGMQKVWDALRSSKKLFPISVFAGSAGHGFCGPQAEARFTPAQHRKFMADVKKRSAELAKLLRGTHLDYTLVSRLDLYRSDVGRLRWGRFSEILDNVDSVARHYAKASGGKRTHGEKARRAYFVRHLTGFFREYLGADRPTLVAIATAAAFDEPNFDASQVIRLTRKG